MPEKQYFDTYVLTRKGVTTVANHDVKQALGFADVQGFDKAMLDAVSHVASTSEGDDCGEGFKADQRMDKPAGPESARPAVLAVPTLTSCGRFAQLLPGTAIASGDSRRLRAILFT